LPKLRIQSQQGNSELFTKDANLKHKLELNMGLQDTRAAFRIAVEDIMLKNEESFWQQLNKISMNWEARTHMNSQAMIADFRN
jgi:hypothetical protein